MISEEQLSSLDGWLTRNEWPAVLVKDLLAEIRALRKIKDAANVLDAMTTYRADSETDSGKAREGLRKALADYERAEVKE